MEGPPARGSVALSEGRVTAGGADVANYAPPAVPPTPPLYNWQAICSLGAADRLTSQLLCTWPVIAPPPPNTRIFKTALVYTMGGSRGRGVRVVSWLAHVLDLISVKSSYWMDFVLAPPEFSFFIRKGSRTLTFTAATTTGPYWFILLLCVWSQWPVKAKSWSKMRNPSPPPQ